MEILIGIVILIIIILIIVSKSRKSNTEYNVSGWVSKSYYETLHEVTTENRGTDFEKDLIVYLLRSGISPKVIFHDLYVQNNKYTLFFYIVHNNQILLDDVKDKLFPFLPL